MIHLPETTRCAVAPIDKLTNALINPRAAGTARQHAAGSARIRLPRRQLHLWRLVPRMLRTARCRFPAPRIRYITSARCRICPQQAPHTTPASPAAGSSYRPICSMSRPSTQHPAQHVSAPPVLPAAGSSRRQLHPWPVPHILRTGRGPRAPITPKYCGEEGSGRDEGCSVDEPVPSWQMQ
jgi:hypothetical protein